MSDGPVPSVLGSGEDPALTVLVALSGDVEPVLARALEADGGMRVVARCADLVDLLSYAEAGRGRVAVVASDLPRLDADAVARLHVAGCRVVAVVDPDRDSSGRAEAMGCDEVVATRGRSGDAGEPALLADRVLAAVRARARGGGSPSRAPATAPRHPAAGRPGEAPSAPSAPAGPSGPSGEAAEGTGRTRAPTRDRPGPDGGPSAGYVDPLPGRPGIDGPADDVDPYAQDLHGPDDTPGRVITVWGASGAPGRTTVAVNLAAEIAAAGRRVLLVDADTQSASVASHLGMLDESAGLVSAVRAAGTGRLTTAALLRIAPEVVTGMRVLTGITRSARWAEVRPAGLESMLRVARTSADVVVVDVASSLDRDDELVTDVTAPRRNAAVLVSLAAADEVLAVGAGDPVGLQRLVRALQEFSASGVTRRPHVVVNKVRASAVGPDPGRRVAAALERFAGVGDPVLVPFDQAGTDAALLAGRTLVEAAPRSPARAALMGLAARVDPQAQVRPPGIGRPRWGRRTSAAAMPTVTA